MKRVLLGAGLVVVLVVIVVMNVRNAREQGVEVEKTVVERKDLIARVAGSGRIEARRSVSITSSVVGKVLEVAAQEGERVERGQLILRVDPGERTSALEQARAALASAEARRSLAQAELRKAEFELDRIENLKKNDLASDQDLEAALTTRDVKEASLASAREDVRNSRAGVERAEYELDRTIVRAEIPGVIVRLSVEEGENVLAGDLYNAGSPIVVIADLSVMEAQILVDETEVVHVAPGQIAEITVDAFPDQELTGKVTEVGNSAYNAGPLGSQEAQDFRIRIVLDDVPGSLRPGLSARAEIVTSEREDVLAVPIEALTIRNPEKEERRLERGRSRRGRDETDDETVSEEVEGVFRIDEGRAVFVPVETGIAGKKDFEILSGLSEGDEIVRGPFEAIRKLESGDKLKIRSSRDRKGAPEARED